MEQYREITTALSEIKERTASVETKVDLVLKNDEKIDQARDIANKAKDSASSAHKRVDKIDKWLFAIGSTVILAVVAAVMGLIMIN